MKSGEDPKNFIFGSITQIIFLRKKPEKSNDPILKISHPNNRWKNRPTDTTQFIGPSPKTGL